MLEDHNKEAEDIAYEISYVGSIGDKFGYLKELHTGQLSTVMVNALNELRKKNNMRKVRKIAEIQTDIICRSFSSFERYADILPLFPTN
jgi:hypothetical protein